MNLAPRIETIPWRIPHSLRIARPEPGVTDGVRTGYLSIHDYQFVSRSGVAVILWMVISVPLNSSSWSRRIPTTRFRIP